MFRIYSNKKKIIIFPLVLYSLNRTFAGRKEIERISYSREMVFE